MIYCFIDPNEYARKKSKNKVAAKAIKTPVINILPYISIFCADINTLT